jgi:hypothetical protein
VLLHDRLLPGMLARYGIAYVRLSGAEADAEEPDRAYGNVFVAGLLDTLTAPRY